MTLITLNNKDLNFEKELIIAKGFYVNNGGLAIAIYEQDTLDGFMDVTVNLEGVALSDNEVAVKTWSENECFVDSLLASGYFKDTGKRVPAGFVQAQIWEVLKPITKISELTANR